MRHRDRCMMLEERWMRKSFKSGNTGDNNGGGGDDGEPNENCKFGPTFGWAQIFFCFFFVVCTLICTFALKFRKCMK